MAARAIAAEERVFSLVLALVASPQGLNKHQLLSSVHGYSSDYVPGGDNRSLERKFERDKEHLRTIGVPLETLDDPGDPGNNQLVRYRIVKSMLQLPESVRFSADELVMLRAAAQAWSEGSLSSESRRAIMKLGSMGSSLDLRQLGVAPQVTIREPQAADLRQAIEGQYAVQFQYRRADQEAPETRRVMPLRLHRADGRWHLISFDFARGEYRVFLLSRMIGSVKRIPAETHVPSEGDVEAVVARLQALQGEQTARVTVRPGSIAAARLKPRASRVNRTADGYEELRLGTLDYRALAEELVAFGQDVAVIEPDELVKQTRAILAEIRAAHSVERGRS